MVPGDGRRHVCALIILSIIFFSLLLRFVLSLIFPRAAKNIGELVIFFLEFTSLQFSFLFVFREEVLCACFESRFV